MADTTINSGAVADLGGLIEQREAKIAAASTDRPKFDFNANKLARSLHPDRQHFLISAVEELQAEVLARLAANGPVTDQMKREVKENVYRDSLLNWVKSFR